MSTEATVHTKVATRGVCRAPRLQSILSQVFRLAVGQNIAKLYIRASFECNDTESKSLIRSETRNAHSIPKNYVRISTDNICAHGTAPLIGRPLLYSGSTPWWTQSVGRVGGVQRQWLSHSQIALRKCLLGHYGQLLIFLSISVWGWRVDFQFATSTLDCNFKRC